MGKQFELKPRGLSRAPSTTSSPSTSSTSLNCADATTNCDKVEEDGKTSALDTSCVVVETASLKSSTERATRKTGSHRMGRSQTPPPPSSNIRGGKFGSSAMSMARPSSAEDLLSCGGSTRTKGIHRVSSLGTSSSPASSEDGSKLSIHPSSESNTTSVRMNNKDPKTTLSRELSVHRMNHEFSSTGKVLTREEKEKARKFNGYCPSCGKQTHVGNGFSLKKRKLTNPKTGVWQGICINCFAGQVPREVLQAHEESKRSEMLLQFKAHGGSDGSKNINQPKFSQVAAEAFAQARKKVHLKKSTRNKVKESWALLEGDLQGLGVDFFVQMFIDYPHLQSLFPFGEDKTEAEMRSNRLLQHHARLAMQMLGHAAMGLADMPALLPKFRQLGRMHTRVGVKPEHYDQVYSSLMKTISRKVGQSKWTGETEEAWKTVYDVIVSIMKDPSRHLDVEPAEGWGLYHTLACLYLAVVTPFRLGGFGGIVEGVLTPYLNALDFVAVGICGIDAFGENLEYSSRLSTRISSASTGSHGEKKSKSFWQSSKSMLFRLSYPARFRFSRLVRRLDLARWAHWQHLDFAILASYAFQLLFHDLLKLPVIQEKSFVTLWRALAFTVALVRCAGLTRVAHFVHCAEIVSLRESTLRRQDFQYLQIGKMLATLAYAIHLFGCMFSMVAQLSGLQYVDPSFFTDGVDNFNDAEFQVRPEWSPFSMRMLPLLINDANPSTLNSYLHGLYWAFVNTTGIGNLDATPETSLEIMFCLLVHLVGTAYYVWAVGTIFGMLQDRARSFYKVEEGIASLTEFLDNCDIPKSDHDKFVSSYIMRNMVDTSGRNGSPVMPTDRPLVPKAAEELPIHLSMELTLHSRAKALRDRGIKNASPDFSFALAESLVHTITLLPGDYLLKAGNKTTPRVYMVDKGVLEVLEDGVSKGHLHPGDVIGKGWLATQPFEAKEMERHKAFVDWRSPDGVAIADIRAMTECRLVMGLQAKSEVIDLQRDYKTDMDLLKQELKIPDRNNSAWDKLRQKASLDRIHSMPVEANETRKPSSQHTRTFESRAHSMPVEADTNR